MDGNRRWSEKNQLSKKQGYIHGINKINEIKNYCINNNINHLTFYALSSENYKRQNINIIFLLIKEDYINFLNSINSENNVKIKIIGEKDNLNKDIKKIFKDIEKKTENNKPLILNIVFNYSLLDEIKNINQKLNDKDFKLDSESDLHSLMYLKESPNPDILIRTGGHKRISNFIPLNLGYTEFFFMNTLWPDFSIDELNEIIVKFTKIKRNYGL